MPRICPQYTGGTSLRRTAPPCWQMVRQGHIVLLNTGLKGDTHEKGMLMVPRKWVNRSKVVLPNHIPSGEFVVSIML